MELTDRLNERASLLAVMRQYLSGHQCVEVTTPVLRSFGVTDPFIASIAAFHGNKAMGFLQTSPEYAMKQLLCLGSGDIWQMGPAFRGGESGRRHRSEFTMLEWYRCGWSLSQLMEEVLALMNVSSGCLSSVADDVGSMLSASVVHTTYRALFEERFGENPHRLDREALIQLSQQELGSLAEHIHVASGRSGYLDALFSQRVEPELVAPTFVTEFPVEQAALAKVSVREGDRVGMRFELYCRGVELANGYEELGDRRALTLRFEENNRSRKRLGLPEMTLDRGLLSVIDQLPDCVGVALGVDRLHMVLADADGLDEIDSTSALW